MRRVSDEMRAPPVLVQTSTTVQEASARMLDAGVQVAVVMDAGKVCGLMTAEAVSAALARGCDASETTTGAVADPDPLVIGADEALADAHQRMRAQRRAVVPVVERGDPVGVLEDSEAAPG